MVARAAVAAVVLRVVKEARVVVKADKADLPPVVVKAVHLPGTARAGMAVVNVPVAPSSSRRRENSVT